MEAEKKSKELLEKELKEIQTSGIQADRQTLKQNMHTQFADPFEFAREYVVNSYDAMATDCYISGRESEDTVTVTIRDNGKGMDKQRIQDYFKIFRSRKDSLAINPIGRFGVGKMSVAAVPGLLSFAGSTSTGKECWRFETDTLTEDRPVTLEKVEPVPSHGTRFEITFKKSSSLAELLKRIYNILYKFVRHLNINIYFDLPEVDDDFNPVRRKLIKGNWLFDPENLGKAYYITLEGNPVEVIMGLGNPEHEIYQNQVYITSKYNLVSYGLKEEYHIPHLRIRVNSEAFELTFGRHCLSNESILKKLSGEIRDNLLHLYYDHLMDYFSEELVVRSPEMVKRIEEMTCALIGFRPGVPSWSSFQLFKVHGLPRVSFNELKDEVEKSGILYIEASGGEGADYSVFNAPVLKLDQPLGGLEVLQEYFGSCITNLNQKDVVIEAPYLSELTLTPEQKKFQNYLFFKPKKEVLNWIINRGKPGDTSFTGPTREQLSELEDAIGICEEAKVVERDLNSIIWRLSYLVERDGKSHCDSRKFLYKDGTIILNLYHPEISEFVELSCINANLAAHWAMAMCLSDPKLLSHITPEAREDLLLIDAMGRIDADFNQSVASIRKTNKDFIEFLRSIKQLPGKDFF